MAILRTQQQDNTNPQFIKPKVKKIKEIDPIFKERLKRTIRSYERGHLSYIFDSQKDNKLDLREQATINEMEIHPEETTVSLVSMTKVQLPESNNIPIPLFEGSDFKPDPKQKTALIYTLSAKVENPESVNIGVRGDIISHCQYKIGSYLAAQAKITFDRYTRQPVDSTLAGTRRTFYIKDDKKTIDAVIKKWGRPQSINVAEVATPAGQLGDTYTVPNFEEWTTEDIPTLIQASRKGLLSVHKGGPRALERIKEIEKKLIEEGVKESDLSKLTKDDFVKLLDTKKVTTSK